ncbi:MAG: glycosyltransferase family 39 protein [Deltaproteobacteria bacterium]|nr:glycosyltransferase family 39 protein [Deltaproteobacteria bacterium]
MSEPNLLPSPPPARRRWLVLAALGLLAATLCFYGLGRNGVHELDEAWQAQAALEMYRSSAWWHPTAFGGPFFSKQALPLWLTVVAYRVFGVTDFATRVWAASFAVAAVLATYLLGESLGGVAVGALAGFVLTTTYPFLYTHGARTGEFDSLMVLCFVVATLLFVRAVRTQRGWAWCAATAAMASNAKNLAGIIPAVVFSISLLAVPRAKRPAKKQLLACVVVFAALNLGWVLPMAALHGRRFWTQYIGVEVLHRPFKAGSHSVQSAASLYFTTLLAGFSPWTILAIGGLLEDARKAMRRRDLGSVVVLVWVGVLALALCLGLRRANQWYLIPLFPFLAVSASRLLLDRDERPRWAATWRLTTAVIALAAALIWQQRPLLHPFALWSITRPQLALTTFGRLATLLVACSAAVLTAWWFRRASSSQQTDGQGARFLRTRLFTVAPVLIALGCASLLSAARPLALADYANAYVRAREVLKEAKGSRQGTLVVNTPQPRFDMMTRYYFGNIDGLNATFVRQGPRAALARARQLRPPVWCILTARRGRLPDPENLPGKVLLATDEPLPGGGTRFELAVVELDTAVRGDER